MPFLRQLPAETVTPEKFKSYGQVVMAAEGDLPFGAGDARLALDQGVPRFYVMRLRQRGRRFRAVTRHKKVTQCLAALSGADWYLAVAPPDIAKPHPDLEKLRAFTIPANCIVKLEVGTWHAGPYFDGELVDFANLELADTNEVDHETWDLHTDGLEYVIVP